MNTVTIKYAYPTSEMAERLGRYSSGCFYAEVGAGVYSPPFETIDGAEGWCRNHCLEFAEHRFRN